MRLIDADAEVERLKKDYCEECTRKGNYGIFGAACTPCWVKDAIEEFENAPTIEAVPVRHGRWKGWTTSKFTGKYDDGEPIYKDYVYYTCSKCYRKSAIQELYCPSCGYIMDRGGNNAG